MIEPSSILTVVAESAARSLLLAGVVGAGLALLRTRNVPARKTAWMLVLAASFAMPLLARWAASAGWIPQSAAFIVSNSSWRSTSPQPVRAVPVSVAPADGSIAATGDLSAMDLHRTAQVRDAQAASSSGSHFPTPTIRTGQLDSPSPAAAGGPSTGVTVSRSSALLMVYLAVFSALFLRLGYGAWVAMDLWRTAKPVDSETTPGIRVRSSSRIESPVTVAGGVVLPAIYRHWDREKLRIVLAHEASHVRQRDFYLQLGASLYAAIFWFSPLGWWLKRILADLGETISDRAAVEHAASHASYAQVLLEFAALPRPIATGVAMAHPGRLVIRIERLLNESSFRQAFAGSRARIAAAVLLVSAAVFGATAMVRVQAAQAAPAAPAAPPSTAPAAPSITPPSADATAAPAAAAMVQAPAGPGTPAPPPGSGTTVVPEGAPSSPDAPPLPPEPGAQDRTSVHTHHGFAYGYNSNGESYAIASKNKANDYESFSGDWDEDVRSELARARAVAHGDFLWFKRDGKAYIVDDPTTVAQLKAMYQPMEALVKQQEALGKQQEELGRQQEELGKQMNQVKVPTPDMKKELDKLQEVTAKLSALQGKTASQEELADLQSQLAEVQGRIGGLQGEMGGRMGDLGGKMGELGGQQGKLGDEQGKLGEQQGRIAREADRKVKSVIDESLKNGKARPVQ